MEDPAQEAEEKLNTGTTGPKTEQITDTETLSREPNEAVSANLPSRVLPDTPIVVKRKRGRPRKGTTSITIPKDLSGLSGEAKGQEQTSSSSQPEGAEDPGDGETDIEVKPKRNRRSKVLHDDYVADFHTSDEEEEVSRRFTGRGRGRGRGQRHEFPEAFDEFFSSYNEFFGKQVLADGKSTFEDQDGGEDRSHSHPIEDQPQGSPGRSHSGKDVMEGVIGPHGQTHVQIVNTGDTAMIDGKEGLIYNVIATTGETKSITPLVIPKAASGVGNGEDNIQPSDSGKTGDGGDSKGTAKFISEEGSKSSVSSRVTQDKGHIDRYILQVTLKHDLFHTSSLICCLQILTM